jgi:DNA-binding MarR family transcriptional regulator
MDVRSPITDFSKDPYLQLVRPLVEAYLAFVRLGNRHIESLGITPAQFEVIAELGNTNGLTCIELTEATLITKGTLTGVLDRLEGKGLIRRDAVKGDRRAIKIQLTKKGETLYWKVFPAHAEFLRPLLKQAFTAEEIEDLIRKLTKLRKSFESVPSV